MAQLTGHADADRPPEEAPGGQRSDAAASRRRILDAAAALAGDRAASMTQIAAAADVGRSTLYRHFPTREALNEALEAYEETEGEPAGRPHGAFAPPPPERLTRAPTAREVEGILSGTRVLDEVPSHLVHEQFVAEVRRLAGVTVAMYIVDIDGTRMLRVAGSQDFPEEIDAPPALGPEIVPEALPSFTARLRETLPGCTPHPLWLRGRVIGIMMSVGTPSAPLEDLLKLGAAFVELAERCSDVLQTARRRMQTSPMAEIQQGLLPPRLIRVTAGHVASTLVPSYDVGGDWFDVAENPDGAWLATADIAGRGGPAKAGRGAVAIGALRAARRAGVGLAEAAGMMDETLRQLEDDEYILAVLLARWQSLRGRLEWISCGHRPPLLLDAHGELVALEGATGPALGEGPTVRSFEVNEARLSSGDRVILATDGVVDRRLASGGTFGLDGMRRAIRALGAPTSAATALAIQQALTASWADAEDDDATLVVLTVD